MRNSFRILLLLNCLAGSIATAATTSTETAAEAALFARDYDKAIALYSKVIAANSKESFAYNSRAIAYREKKEYSKAMADLNQAIELNPSALFFFNRGVTYSEEGNQTAAIKDLSRALKSPSAQKTDFRGLCLVARGRCYFLQEKIEPALSDLNLAIKRGTKDPDGYVLRGVLHKIAHDYAKSLADYEKAIALNRKDPRSYAVAAYLLAVCPAPKYRNGQKAIEYATKACELSHWKDASNLQTLAAAYAEAAQFDQAIKFQKEAEALDPKGGDSRRLALYQKHHPYRDLNRGTDAIPPPTEGAVSITLGQKLHVHFTLDGGRLINPEPSQGGGKLPPDSFGLEFQLKKGQRLLFLHHSFGQTIRVKCLARLQGQDAYWETDLLPVPVNTLNPEIWSEALEELILFDFHLADEEPEQGIAAR